MVTGDIGLAGNPSVFRKSTKKLSAAGKRICGKDLRSVKVCFYFFVSRFDKSSMARMGRKAAWATSAGTSTSGHS